MSLILYMSDAFLMVRVVLGEKKNAEGISSSTWHAIEGYMVSTWLFMDEVNSDRLAKLEFVRLFTVKLLFFLFYILYSLDTKSLSPAYAQDVRDLNSTSWREDIYL